MLKRCCATICRPISKLNEIIQSISFLAPLAIRIYLVPILWVAGMNKLANVSATAAWFGNPDWGLGLPYPHLMVYLAGGFEIVGAVLLCLGLGLRLITIPLMVIMLTAAFLVHWDNGWLAIAHQSAESTQRLHETLNWLKTNYADKHKFITELGRPVILNNGIEFAITYFILLLSLFFTGAGKYVSLDYWLCHCCFSRETREQ